MKVEFRFWPFILLVGIAVVITWVVIKKGEEARRITIPKPPLIEKKPAPAQVPAVPPPKAKAAIVLDDWGYRLENISVLYSIDRPLTLAVLPNTRYGRRIAREAKEKGYEVILHLPLEYQSKKITPEPRTIYCRMTDGEILDILRADLEDIPESAGVSNHMGSTGTENPRVMRVIFDELKGRNLFFVDSLTTGKSVCGKVSKDVGIRFVKRNIFLDIGAKSDSTPEQKAAYVREQIRSLIGYALKNGQAVGIGHDKAITLSVLREMIPEIERNQIKLVKVSELVK
jgi:polysaccharide deacetylase 2 family uncharacterized protein YibQ